MITELILPETEEDTDQYKEYCHICCTCSPQLTLCGGFKAVQCGLFVVDTVSLGSCPKCNKQFCPDCSAEMPNVCPRCGQ